MAGALLLSAVGFACANGLEDAGGAAGSGTDQGTGAAGGGTSAEASSGVQDSGLYADTNEPGADGGLVADAAGLDASKADASKADAGQSSKDASVAPDASSSSDAAVGTVAAQGELLITEVMYNPSGSEPDDEWIEVTNVTSGSRVLTGLTLEDGSGRTHVIQTGATKLEIAPGAAVVLARNKSAAVAAHVPSSGIVYEYGAGLAASTGIQLANGSTGAVILRASSVVVSQVAYGGWYAASGASLQMRTPYAFASGTDKTAFCVAQNPFPGSAPGGANLGTPGNPNDCN
jgi:hypothetical protein